LQSKKQSKIKERKRSMPRRGENIYKRKDGRYEGRYIKYYDFSGKAVYGYVYSKSYSDIKEKLSKCKKEKSFILNNDNKTLKEWMEIWVNSQKSLKISTLNIYKSHIKNHINPCIGNILLKKLNKDIIQNFINNIDLKPSSVRSIFYTLKSALKDAEEKGFLENNWSKVKLPASKKTFVKILSVNEQHILEKNLKKDSDIGILICLYTGLRIGEVCALKWSDIDFENSILCVNGTQIRTKNGLEIISPKSSSSKREIPVPEFLLEKIKNVKNKSEFVVSSYIKPFDVRNYRRYFKEKIKESR